jgi:transcriptional regulator with XRE-family HTH domain
VPPSTTTTITSIRPQRRRHIERLSGSEIRSARKAKQLTQSQLAEVLHVHQSLIAKIEVGQRTVTADLERTLRQVLEL